VRGKSQGAIIYFNIHSYLGGPMIGAARSKSALYNHIKGIKEKNQEIESSPPTPQGAEEEDESFPGSKPKRIGQAEREAEPSQSVPLSRKEQLFEIRSKMIALKNGREFDCLPPKEKVELADLGIKFLSVRDNDPELEDDFEEFLTDRMEEMGRYRSVPVIHEPAYRATWKRNFLKEMGRIKGTSSFERWRGKRIRIKIIKVKRKERGKDLIEGHNDA
jgi:hypothetical protein